MVGLGGRGLVGGAELVWVESWTTLFMFERGESEQVDASDKGRLSWRGGTPIERVGSE